jgi:nucleolar MIF4G domain-containing protein 1
MLQKPAQLRSVAPTEVTTTLTDMIIRTISDRANLLDSFVILYASFVAALYKLKGADLGERMRLREGCNPEV